MKKHTDLQQLIGAWRLVSSKKILTDGGVVDVFGKDPMGYFVFTQEAIMSVQIMRRERKSFHGDGLLDDYLAYTGRFELDDQEKIITLYVETSLSANYLGKEIKRKYQFNDNRLELRVLESDVDYRVTWERVFNN